MRANYPRRNTDKKKDEVLARYINEYIALCMVYGAAERNQRTLGGRMHKALRRNSDIQ